jgi:hypothetical protein
MNEYGFKTITAENWLEVDPIHHHLIVFNEDLTKRPQETVVRLKMILEPTLNATVPLEVRRLYEVARGTMVYSNLFYPLYALGAEQLPRVAEAAIREKYIAAGGRNPKRTFNKQIDWLKEQDILSAEAAQRWQVIKKGRNRVSHLVQQSLFSAAQATAILQGITDEINALFDDEPDRDQ